MKGDFSNLPYPPRDNATGVWHQQGRVLIDQDWNAATAIQRHLRELLGQDVIGANLVGIPAAEPASWQVTQALADGATVELTLNPGRGWIDGLHLYMNQTAPVTLPATWYGPPSADPQPDAGSIASGVRDAVILEVWEESFSAFQDPLTLLEPALGGPDTTLRSVLHYRLRLLRLEDGEDCGNMERLQDDPASMGHLTVTPAPTLAIAGDCPLEAGGGYEGFEHYYYRLEVAAPDGDGNARFKYSRFNGGLVGRGTFDNALDQITVLANDQMINHCGLDNFYLEVLAPHPSGTYWEVTMSAAASRVGNGVLTLTGITGAWPGAGTDEAFFRLWDGTRLISSFATGIPEELELGIMLAFDPATAGNSNYQPGAWWSFPVRAAGTDFDPAQWPDNAAPFGVTYHRAPLAVLNWSGGPVVSLSGAPAIHDCRRVFQPLTRIQTCCTLKVGDGLHSFGDFDSIQQAVNHLPASGGEICVLPGTYRENVTIDKDNVHIHGCGHRSIVIGTEAADGATATAVFNARGQHHLSIRALRIEAAENGAGIIIEGGISGEFNRIAPAEHIALENLQVIAGAESAIRLFHVAQVIVKANLLQGKNVAGAWSPLFVLGDDVLIEHNRVVVEAVLDTSGAMTQTGRGGIHLAGTSERVSVIDNHVEGGIGHGIVLGSVETLAADGNPTAGPTGWIVNAHDPCDPCSGGGVLVNPNGDPDKPDVRYQSAGALYDIRIERNHISRMGLCGIGVVAFFPLDAADELISVFGLDILGNTLTHNLWRDLQTVDNAALDYMAYGAVCLADVEALRLYDNLIEDNGPNHLKPVCGVFVLHVEGADICRNRIANNGRETAEARMKNVERGRRGGIVIPYALPGIDPIFLGGEFRPRQNGIPAVRVHDNIVSQPLGQALALGGMGPMSIQANQFTSKAFVQRTDDSSFLATTVLVLNLGLSNEFYLQTLLFRGATSDPVDVGDLPQTSNGFIPLPARGVDDQGIGRYLANGNVMFCDNQVFLDLTEPEVSFAISQAAIISLDDVSVQNNQFDCDFLVDILFTNLLTVGMTTRVQNNRFKESLMITLFSSINLGLIFNNTSANQATHCFLNLASPLSGLSFLSTSIVARDNQVLFNAFSFLGFWCEALGRWSSILAPNDDNAKVAPGASANLDTGMTVMWGG